MGKTYKDRQKWDRKQRDIDSETRVGKRPNRKRQLDEIVPEDEPLDPYEYLDYEYEE